MQLVFGGHNTPAGIILFLFSIDVSLHLLNDSQAAFAWLITNAVSNSSSIISG